MFKEIVEPTVVVQLWPAMASFFAFWLVKGCLFEELILLLNLIREFLGPSPSVFSGEKSRFITGDVTVVT